jgi:hypothetical protein
MHPTFKKVIFSRNIIYWSLFESVGAKNLDELGYSLRTAGGHSPPSKNTVF